MPVHDQQLPLVLVRVGPLGFSTIPGPSSRLTEVLWRLMSARTQGEGVASWTVVSHAEDGADHGWSVAEVGEDEFRSGLAQGVCTA
jgi:hypothetical protein